MRMKRKVRNVICFLLAIVMIAPIYPVYAEEEYTYTDANGVDYVYTDTGVLLSVEGVVGALDLTEMATAKNITIKAIGNGAFQYSNAMTSINLPASVEMHFMIVLAFLRLPMRKVRNLPRLATPLLPWIDY